MKKILPRFSCAATLCAALTFAVSGANAADTPIYWNTTAGAWDTTTQNWSTDQNGDNPTNWSNAANLQAVFSALNGQEAPYTVTVSGTQNPDSIWMQNDIGTITLSGGGLSITSGSVEVDAHSTLAIGSALTVSNGLTKTGDGTLTLSGANTYTEDTTISGGTLSLDQNGSLNNTTNITIDAGSTLSLNATSITVAARDKLQSGNRTTSSLVISGTLANNGAAETRLYAATITMNNGTIACNGGEAQYGSFSISGGAGDKSRTITANGASNFINGTGQGIGLDTGNTLTFDTPTLSDGLVVSVALGGNGTGAFSGGSVVKSGSGTVTFSGNNTFTGGLTVSGGTLNYTGGGNVTGSGGDVNIASGATLNLSGVNNNQLSATGTWTIGGTLAATSNAAQSIRATSVILNSGTMTSSGGNGGQAATYGAFYVYLPNTTITANGENNVISGNGDLGIQNVTLTLATTSATDSLLVSTNVKNGGGGTSGGVTKTGAGTVTFTGTNSYSGATTISEGTLLVNGNQSAAHGATTVAAGATLGGSGTIGSTLTTITGNITGGTDGGIDTLTTGALTLNSTATFKLDLNSTSNLSDELISTGALSLGDSTLAINDLAPGTPTGNLIIASGASLNGQFSDLAQGASVDGGLYTIDYGILNANEVTLIAVPEPSTFALAGIFGFGILLLFRRRRSA